MWAKMSESVAFAFIEHDPEKWKPVSEKIMLHEQPQTLSRRTAGTTASATSPPCDTARTASQKRSAAPTAALDKEQIKPLVRRLANPPALPPSRPGAGVPCGCGSCGKP